MKKRSILLLLAIIGALVFSLGSASAGPGDRIDVKIKNIYIGFVCWDADPSAGSTENGTQCGPNHDMLRVGAGQRAYTIVPSHPLSGARR